MYGILKSMTIKFIEMREELIETLRALSDKKYQQSAWVRQEFPKGIEYDNFDLAVHFLFDDTCLAENPEDLIGYCLVNKQEAQLVFCVTESIDKLLSKLGNDLSDSEYISSPLWEDIIQTSKQPYEVIKSNSIF
jgi:hypothetical protein